MDIFKIGFNRPGGLPWDPGFMGFGVSVFRSGAGVDEPGGHRFHGRRLSVFRLSYGKADQKKRPDLRACRRSGAGGDIVGPGSFYFGAGRAFGNVSYKRRDLRTFGRRRRHDRSESLKKTGVMEVSLEKRMVFVKFREKISCNRGTKAKKQQVSAVFLLYFSA